MDRIQKTTNESKNTNPNLFRASQPTDQKPNARL